MNDLRIIPAGDAALVLELPSRIDPAVTARLVFIADSLRERAGTAVRDTVVGYCTLTVYFDPILTDASWLEEEMRAVASLRPPPAAFNRPRIDIPVCYGGDLGPDLAAVAEQIGATEDEVIDLHCTPEYRVFVVGFVPGFAYMGEVHPRLALPRRSSPRTKVPAGSVAIAAGQTGIYPMETPGGWQLLGRTFIRPFDEARDPPVLFRPGDRVKFHAIGRAEYDLESAG